MYLLPVCIQLNSTYEDCVAVVPMSTYEGCGCCTYDLPHSPWLLLLLLIVDQLVYHAVLLLCHIYHPAHVMRLYDEHMLEVFRFFFSAQTCTNNV